MLIVAMAFQSDCQGCAFVARQLGAETPCFLHVGRAYFESLGEVQPGLFTLHEYTRLLALRGRIQRRRWTAAQD
jgi:hypothetical protein